MSVHTQSQPDRVTHAQPRQRNHSRWKRFTAAIGAIALGFAGLVGATAAQAATPDGISVDVLYKGAVISDGGTQNIPEGDQFQLRVSYNTAAEIWGQEITFTIPENITLPGSLPSNPAVEGITDNGDGTYTVKFWDDAPDGVGSEGAFVFNLRASEVDGESSETISWESGALSGGITIVIEDTTVPPAPIEDRYAKSVNPGNLNGFVEQAQDDEGHYYFTGLSEDIEDAILTYTLVLASAEERTNYEIADVLEAGLGYVSDSFEATLDPAGDSDFVFNPTVSGSSFSGTVSVPAQSTLTITYQVQVTDVAALEAALETAFEEQRGGVGGSTGNYSINVRNTATFGGGNERTADVYIGGNIPGVGIGDNFGKSGNWTLQDVIADEDGTLVPAAEMTYMLRANLAPWDGRNSNFKLTRNVVITDTLIEQAEWKTGDSDFITVHPENGDGLQGLTQATSFTGTAAEFADDAYVGQWAIVGNQLLVNVGKDNATNVWIAVKAQLNTVDGLTGSNDTTVVGGERFPWNNQAQFYYRDGGPENRDFNSSVVVIPDELEGGIEDSAAFNKTSASDEVQVQPGQSAEIPYNFRINTSKGQIDPLKSTIVDTINTSVFDVSDVASIPVSGSYGGTPLTAEHFDVTLEGNDLMIVLSEAGKTLVGAQAEGAIWSVNIVLTTVEFDGKETFEIYNSAKLIGEDTVWDYKSDDETEATSFGNEAEIRKRVYDQETGAWVSELNALIEGDAFVNERFVYSIELIPRGSYGAEFPVSIFARVDNLPGAVDFIGFTSVDSDGAPILDSIGDEVVQDMNGNIEAAYDAAERTVTIEQKPGTSLDPSQRIITYFAVDANDASDEIVNSIDGSSATITPYGDPSIDIEKWNVEGDERPEYDETGALLNDKEFAGDRDTAEEAKDLAPDTDFEVNFTISNDGREKLVDIVVSDQLTDGAGVIENLTCDFSPLGGPESGTGWAGPFEIGAQFECVGTLPGLAEGDTHANLARVNAVGETTGIEVEDEDEWHARVPVPSIDIEKWNVEGDERPEYDETGALLNDKEFAGDRDTAEESKALAADTPFQVNFTISNDGEENLVDIVVSDELTGGVGAIEDLTCDFSPLGGPESGTEWAGPFEIGAQFECVGTLPALSGGDIHANLAKVEGVGEVTGIVVGDEDEWHAHVPQPSVGIEKWTDEGEAPEYDASGALLNDGYAGDFDKAPGKKLEAGKSQVINFTITNDGPEALLDVVVSDNRTGGVGDVQDLLCVFPDGSEGTSWDGPFEVGVQFECTGILPGLKAGESHADEVTVSGVGAISGIEVGDADEWHGYTDAPLSNTGSTSALWIGIAGGSLLLAGLAIVLARRRMSAE